MLRHSGSLSSESRSENSTTEEYEEERYFEPIPEIDFYGVIIESHSDARYPASKKRSKIIHQQLSSTNSLCTKRMVANFTSNINDFRINRVN